MQFIYRYIAKGKVGSFVGDSLTKWVKNERGVY